MVLSLSNDEMLQGMVLRDEFIEWLRTAGYVIPELWHSVYLTADVGIGDNFLKWLIEERVVPWSVQSVTFVAERDDPLVYMTIEAMAIDIHKLKNAGAYLDIGANVPQSILLGTIDRDETTLLVEE